MIKSLFIILFINAIISYSSEKVFRSDFVSLEEGISNNLIFSIYQDSEGYIWYGTMFGLIKYDGIKYTTFRYNPDDSTTISNDDVISICEDNSGYLWIGTYFGGLNRLDKFTGKFTRFIHNDSDKSSLSNNTVWTIICDSKGTLWFGTDGGGLNKYSDGKFTVYKNDSLSKSSISNNYIYALTEGIDGIIWAGTGGGGLNRFETGKGIFTSFTRNTQDSLSISGNFIRSLYYDKKGYLWVGTMQRGFSMLDVSYGGFTRFSVPADSGLVKNGKVNINNVNTGSVFSFIPSYNNNNEIWVCSNNGLYSLNKSTGKLMPHDIYNGIFIKNKNIVAACMDNSGILWLSTYNKGLNKYYEYNNNFKAYGYQNGKTAGLSSEIVKCFCEDIFKNIWIGTDNGLNRFDRNNNEFHYYFNHEISGKIVINSVKSDSTGSLWLGTESGLIYFNPVTNVITKYQKDSTDNHSISSNNVKNVLISSDGSIWAGTDNGLNRFDKVSGKFERFINKPDSGNSLSENTVLSLYEDKFKNIWAGTYGGLNMINYDLHIINRYIKDLNNASSLSNNYIFSFCEDNNGNLWIGTGGGLNKFNQNDRSFVNFSEKDGIDNSVICGILPDAAGNLWLSTKKGLSSFNVNTRKFKNYSSDDGISGNMFNENSYLKTSNGELLFGGINGFTMFNPEEITERSFMPPVILTSFSTYKGNNFKTLDVSSRKEVKVSYDENILTFDFASLDFYAPQKNKYSYILEGFENDWKYPGHNSKAVYTNLDPGKYVFRVKGTNSDGIWSNKEASITLIIMPPFWKTWWFYSLIFLSVVFSVYFIHNIRLRNRINTMLNLEKARENEREKIRQEASRDYHDELGHKLTRISIFTRRINKRLGSDLNGISDDLKGIIDISESLQSGAKDLIWSMNPDDDTLYDFAVRLKDFGNNVFDNTGIQFVTKGIEDSLKNIKLNMKVKKHLIFIFKEAINNALKYSACSAAELTFHLKGNILEIDFTDNGAGFNVKDAAKGYGLKNIQNRAKQINADITLDSGPGLGTIIKFTIGV